MRCLSFLLPPISRAILSSSDTLILPFIFTTNFQFRKLLYGIYQQSTPNSFVMEFPNHLAAHSYEGKIGGIEVSWHPNAQTRLQNQADLRIVEMPALKAATEHLAHRCAERLGKTEVRIMYGWLHDNYSIASLITFSRLLGHHSTIQPPMLRPG